MRMLLALAVLVLLPVDAAQAEIRGIARVLNGDTLQIGETALRLHGIDAPEMGQMCENELFEYPCGHVARGVLTDLLGGRAIDCVREGVMPGGMVLATCYLEGRNVGEMMVRRGIALAHPEDGAAYLEAQAAAREANLSLWRGPFVTPWEWRAGRR